MDKSVKLEDLFYIKEIGFGTYGKVYLVHNKKNFYAMKAADIQEMSADKVLCQYYLNEKSIMLCLTHPFIVKLYSTFRVPGLIFFLMEYVEGITLREYMLSRTKETQFRDRNTIIFYGSILFIVLNYLQKMRILHRDLKPENLMVQTDGYLKVIDFGISKDLAGKDSTNTVIGTPHYMAPEIINGSNYGFASDYWSTGIILYELFYGKTPFGEGEEDGNKVCKEITENKPVFPSDNKNKDVISLIKLLLCKNPAKRLGSFMQIKNQSLFKDFNFDDVNDKLLKPIYIPNSCLNNEDLVSKNKSFVNAVVSNFFASSGDLSIIPFQNNTEKSDYLSDF